MKDVARSIAQTVLALAWIVAMGAGGARAQSGAETFAPEVLHADLDALIETVEAVHPDPYRYTSRRAVRRLHRRIEQKITAPMTVRAFYPYAARLAAAFGDGHTRVDLPREAFADAARGGARTFPFTVRPAAGGLAADRTCSLDRTLPPGLRLLRVNGRDADRLFATIQRALPGTPAYREAVAGDQWPFLLWAHGMEAPFRVRYARPEGGVHAMTLPGVDFGRVRGCLSPRAPAPFSFRYAAGQSGRTIGVITLRSLTQPRRFRRFLGEVAAELKQRPVDGLVIDLRENPGGRTRVARMMVAALTDRPVRLNARKDWKVSAEYQRHLRRRGASSALQPYLDARPGHVIAIEYEAERPPDVPLRYRGPAAVLVGPRTFSSAVTLAGALQAYDLATVVGQETGGRANRFGEGYAFRLPTTRLSAMASTAYLVQASGRRTKGGIRPDVRAASPVGVDSDLALGTARAVLTGR